MKTLFIIIILFFIGFGITFFGCYLEVNSFMALESMHVVLSTGGGVITLLFSWLIYLIVA